MNLLEPFFLAAILALAGCSPLHQTAAHVSSKETAIIGGKELMAGEPQTRYVALIYSEDASGQSNLCTGTFVATNAVLTAAHCLASDMSKMDLMYGTRIDGDVVHLTLTKIVRYEPPSTAQKGDGDLALVFFSGGLPAGAKLVKFDGFTFALNGQAFWAVGYGQTEGSPFTDNSEETGILRSVSLKADAVNIKRDSFTIDQSSGRGVCFGDSGGPALVESGNQTFVVGVAAGVVTSDVDAGDQCQHKSIYVRVRPFSSWISQTLMQ